MSTSRSTDMGDYVLVETGEPTVESPSVWLSRDMQWKAGTPAANRALLESRAVSALAANSTYLALASPSTAQNTAQVQKLTRECSALIRLLLSRVDDTAGT